MAKLDRLSTRVGMDSLGAGLAGGTNAVFGVLGRPGRLLQDFLNGSWLGHPLHAVLVDVPTGGFTILIALDLLAIFFGVPVEPAALIVLVISLLGGLASIVTGLTDMKDSY